MKKTKINQPGCDNGGHRPSWIGDLGVRECDTCLAYLKDGPEGKEIWIHNIAYAGDGKFLKYAPTEKNEK